MNEGTQKYIFFKFKEQNGGVGAGLTQTFFLKRSMVGSIKIF